jgi:hypothetical protein
MAATTNLTTYQPQHGIAPTQALAHAVGHIEKFAKKHFKLERDHETLRKESEAREASWKSELKKHGGTVLEFLVASGTGAGMGYVNGRWGGEKDHAAIYGVPIDVSTIVAGHAAGLLVGYLVDDELGHQLSRGLHSVGNASAGIVTYRLAFQKGTEKRAAAAAGATAQANGVKGGTVYTAPPAHK